jgi:hypothetical protein
VSEAAEWEWRQENPADYETLNALEVHAVYALGEQSGLVVKQVDEDNSGGAHIWMNYTVYSQEREGFGGYEAICGFQTLDEAKRFADDGRAEILSIIREGQ